MTASPESGRIELFPLEGATSFVWKYFGFQTNYDKFVELEKRNKQASTVNCMQKFWSTVFPLLNAWALIFLSRVLTRHLLETSVYSSQ